jgi:small subunit ribosomal protein S9
MADTLTIPTIQTSAAAPAPGVAPGAAPGADVRPLAQPAKPDKGGFIWGTGRRKTAVARVRVKPGEGKFLVNGREVNAFFTEMRDRTDVAAPLKATKTDGKLDVYAQVHGGGFAGQAGAVVLGVARALKGYDPSLEPILRDNGFLTRDPREVERKKYGQSGARRRFQFSKR